MSVYRRQENVVTEIAVVTQQLTTNVVSTATIAQTEQPAETAPPAASPPPAVETPEPDVPPAAVSSAPLRQAVFPSSVPETTLSEEAGASIPSISGPLGSVPEPTDVVDGASVSGNSSSSLSPGLITAVVLVAVLVCMALVGVAFSLHRRKQRKDHSRGHSDARSTIMWDNPPRPMMRGASLSLKPKQFAPPSHTFMQPQSSSTNDPYQNYSSNIEMPLSAGSTMPSPYGVAGGTSPFADPTPSSPRRHQGNMSAEDDGAIRNPFADPRRTRSSFETSAGVAL